MKNIIRTFLAVALLFSFASCKKDKADAAFKEFKSAKVIDKTVRKFDLG